MSALITVTGPLDNQRGASVVKVEGEIDVTTVDQVRDALNQAFTQSAQDIVLDLTGVNFLDSTALGLIAGAASKAKDAARAFTLVSPHPQTQKLLAVTGLDKHIPLVVSMDTALAADPSQAPGEGSAQ